MDFRPGETQQAASKAAATVLGSRPPSAPGSMDVEAWRLLAASGLLGLAVSEEYGGAGCGVLEVCSVLVEQGRYLAAVPIAESVLAAAPAIERYGGDQQRRALLPAIAAGELVAVPALGEAAVETAVEASTGGSNPTLRGAVSGVPYGTVADRLLVPAARGDGPQFGRPIATFQAVATRAADAYADVETARVTMWRAAWLLAVQEPATSAVAVAKFWAAEAGYRVSATAQHLHGGIGVSTDYPLHRCTRWARQNELTFGAAGAQLAVLGGHLAGPGVDS